MQAHEERVVNERNELAERHEKLVAFITGNKIFATLPDEDQALLRQQRYHMFEYLNILDRRIARFKT